MSESEVVLTPSPALTDINIALLRYSKRPDIPNFDWEAIRDILMPFYNCNLKLQDVIRILMKEFQLLASEKRFETQSVESNLCDLLLSPIKGPYNVSVQQGNYNVSEVVFGLQLNYQASLEDFYNSIINVIMSKYMLSNIGWCRDVLFPGETNVT